MMKSWLITPDEGPAYLLTMPEGESPEMPEGYTVEPAPPPPTEEAADQEHARIFRGDGTWESPAGVSARAERDRKIDAARWATDPATSPLSEACRLEWIAYTKALHRISVDFEAPDGVVWPSEPAIEFD
jgi:hypothetical protein